MFECRAQSDRECAEVRERERVHRVDGRRTCAVQLRTTRQADLGIEAAVTRQREQVPSHEADVPIAGPRDRADVIGYEHFAQLRVARILHGLVVGEQLVVEPAEPRESVLPRCAPVIPDRLRRLDRLPDLINVA